LTRWIPAAKQQKVHREFTDKEPDLISRVIQIKDVDVDKGGAFCGGDVASYLATLEVFFNDCQTRIGQLENCIATGNVDLYTTYVHALKSACANIGADKISKNAALLEAEGKRFNSEFINNHNEGFIESLKTLLEDIKESVSSYKASQPEKDPINYEEVKIKLAELKDSMCNFDVDGIDEASEALRNFTHATDIGDKIKEILQLSFVGKYREAIFEIETLIDLIIL
jgi:HPt (histidine-containing phosphotransfer) domain-containing protein